MSIAREFLLSLLKRSQNAVGQGKDEQVYLPLTASSCPKFFKNRNAEDANSFHSELELAERFKAIVVKKKPCWEIPTPVIRVTVHDLGNLARYLGVPLRRDAVSNAHDALDPHADDFPVLVEVMARWQKGLKVRGHEADDNVVTQIQDAIKVITERRKSAGDELLRRVSALLLGDSKRIEAIAKWIDILWFNSVAPSGLDDSEIFSAIGLYKEPLPILIAGDLTAIMSAAEVKLAHPYLGLSPAHIKGFIANGAQLYWRVLTIENRQTFHEFAEAALGQAGLVLLYTGGMPSPSWRRVYKLVFEALPKQNTDVFHFSDLDLGGMRISAVISETAGEAGFILRPWLMEPATLISMGHELKLTPEAVSKAMTRTSLAIGWHDLASQIETHPGTLEQEVVLPKFPASPA